MLMIETLYAIQGDSEKFVLLYCYPKSTVLHLIKTIHCCSYETSFSRSLGVWTSVHYNTHATPATALHWLYLSQRGGRHSQWACVLLSRWILIYSTHFLRIYKTIPSLNKTAKNAKNGKNVIQADSQLLQSDLAPLSPWVPLPPSVHIDGFHYPHWVNSCGSFALSIFSYLPLWNTFHYFKQYYCNW